MAGLEGPVQTKEYDDARKRERTARLCASLLRDVVLANFAHADEDPLNDPEVQKTLRGMANASTWFHPDLFGEFAGMRHYAHHEYRDALKYFEIGALYADKMSQLCLGLMHMNGEGTPKDPVTAYAWLDLAAERDYPDFVATRDSLKKTLTPEQLAKAQVLRAELGAKYGDAVAKPRLAVQLRQGQMQMHRFAYRIRLRHLPGQQQAELRPNAVHRRPGATAGRLWQPDFREGPLGSRPLFRLARSRVQGDSQRRRGAGNGAGQGDNGAAAVEHSGDTRDGFRPGIQTARSTEVETAMRSSGRIAARGIGWGMAESTGGDETSRLESSAWKPPCCARSCCLC